ncbi:MAG: acyl-CoA reductase [Pedobacter sp.]|nr:MAG: acyl-CoA reductase [Pedobacter sp.]
MSIIKKEKFLSAYIQLGKYLNTDSEELQDIVAKAARNNAWFQESEIKKAITALAFMLNEDDLNIWFDQINLTDNPKKVGLILAGNIPMVGIHDILCVIASGHSALVKLSSSDTILIPFIVSKLSQFESSISHRIEYVDRIQGYEAIIATGSNNSARYFDFYFGKVPNIIRKNRNSVAILNGNESDEQIHNLGRDIFDYFGLGCRNVSKIYLPKNYPIEKFYIPLSPYKVVLDNFKYQNNYDYNKSIYLVNLEQHYDNGFILLKESASFSSPLGVLYFEYYDNLSELTDHLNQHLHELQCVLCEDPIQLNKTCLKFGNSQHPRLWDYADDINTLKFLENL